MCVIKAESSARNLASPHTPRERILRDTQVECIKLGRDQSRSGSPVSAYDAWTFDRSYDSVVRVNNAVMTDEIFLGNIKFESLRT